MAIKSILIKTIIFTLLASGQAFARSPEFQPILVECKDSLGELTSTAGTYVRFQDGKLYLFIVDSGVPQPTLERKGSCVIQANFPVHPAKPSIPSEDQDGV